MDTPAERDGERKAEAKRAKLEMGASAAKPAATNTRLRKKTSVHTKGEGDDDKAAVRSGGRVRKKAAVHSGGDHGKGAAIAKALEAYMNYAQLVQRGMQYK